MSDYKTKSQPDAHEYAEARENSPESVETGATIKIDPTAFVDKSINPSTQYDSEGMCVEE